MPAAVSRRPLRDSIRFAVARYADRKLPWLAHASGAHLCSRRKASRKGRIYLASDRHYSKPLIQSQRGRRSSSCSANHRIFSSRSMACSRRSFASSMRPVTVAQRASFKKIDASVGCQARALRRTVSSCSTFPARLTAWASRIHVVGFFGSAFTRSTAIATAISQFSAARHIFSSSVQIQVSYSRIFLSSFSMYPGLISP